jgi:hypothetical protein
VSYSHCYDVHISDSLRTQPGALGIKSVLALQSLDSFNYLGLNNGTIYEIPQASNGTGTINVTGTYFDVTCNFVSNTTVDNHTIYYEEGEYGIAQAVAPPVFCAWLRYLTRSKLMKHSSELPGSIYHECRRYACPMQGELFHASSAPSSLPTTGNVTLSLHCHVKPILRLKWRKIWDSGLQPEYNMYVCFPLVHLYI